MRKRGKEHGRGERQYRKKRRRKTALYSVGAVMEAQAVLSEVLKDEGDYRNSGGGMA